MKPAYGEAATQLKEEGVSGLYTWFILLSLDIFCAVQVLCNIIVTMFECMYNSSYTSIMKSFLIFNTLNVNEKGINCDWVLQICNSDCLKSYKHLQQSTCKHLCSVILCNESPLILKNIDKKSIKLDRDTILSM